MSFYVVDVESDGPIPGDYSMLSFAAVRVTEDLKDTFYSGIIRPISKKFDEKALAVNGIDRDEALMTGKDPYTVMYDFMKWVERTNIKRPVFTSDNNGYDWQFINWYFHHYLQTNPFGFSSRRIGDLYCGLAGDAYSSWKHLRKTKHTHHPLDDAKGNAEALLALKNQCGLRIGLK